MSGPSISPSSIPWPPLSWEQQVWNPPPGFGVTRRDRGQVGRTYDSAVPASIARLHLAISGETLANLDEATSAIASFDAQSSHRSGALLAVLMRTESASSSQIEQITASARAVAEAEFTGQGSGNAVTVAANVHAMTDALHDGGAITSDRIEHIQATLMRDNPTLAGWRQEPVWIGGGGSTPVTADFVPPAHPRIRSAIHDLVAFAAREDLPILAQAAIMHAQFETIHPFADGNGRTGRALVHVLLADKQLSTSTVPISSGLLLDKSGYFDALTAYRRGDAGPIVTAFSMATLHAVAQGRDVACRINDVENGWRTRISARTDSAVWRVLGVLPAHPVFDAATMASAVGTDERNIHRSLRTLTEAGVLEGGQHFKSRRFLFRVPEILSILDDYSRRFGRRR